LFGLSGESKAELVPLFLDQLHVLSLEMLA
jgi:hypothetical protein